MRIAGWYIIMIWWPGMLGDIHHRKKACFACSVPSNLNLKLRGHCLESYLGEDQPKKNYIDSCLQPSDTKYVVINRGGGLVYRGWTSSQIRQESILWNHVTKTAFQACWQHIDQCLCSSDLIKPKAYGRRKAQNLPVFWQQLQPCLEGSFYEKWDKIF